MGAFTLDRQAVVAAEPAETRSGVVELLVTDGQVELRVDTLPGSFLAQVLTGDLAHGTVVAVVVVRVDDRPAAEGVQHVAARLALLAAQVFAAVRAQLVPHILEAEEHGELVFLVALRPRANLALALLLRGWRRLGGDKSRDGGQKKQLAHLGESKWRRGEDNEEESLATPRPEWWRKWGEVFYTAHARPGRRRSVGKAHVFHGQGASVGAKCT